MAGVIHYWDRQTGSDSTGDGTPSKPYASMYKACTGLGADDEARAAKGPSHTALGNAIWTEGSKTVEFAGAPGLVGGNYIAKSAAGGPGSAETCWAVATCVGTTVTLVATYSGTTGTVATKQIGTVASPGEWFPGLGSTAGHPLVVSGGWDLATELRDGETWLHGGYIDNNAQGYVRFEYLGLLNCSSNGLNMQNGSNIDLDHVTANGCSGSGIRSLLVGGTWGDVTGCGNTAYGISFYDSARAIVLATATADSNGVDGVYMRRAAQCLLSDITARYNANAGVNVYLTAGSSVAGLVTEHNLYAVTFTGGSRGNDLSGITATGNTTGICFDEDSDGNVLSDVTLTGNTTGIYSRDSLRNIVNRCVHSGNTADRNLVAGQDWTAIPSILMHRYDDAAGDHRWYYEYGLCQRNTTEQQVGLAECWQFTPTSATYYIGSRGLDDVFVAQATSGTELTLKLYLKKSADFNGNAVLEAYVDGQFTDTSVPTLTTSWAEYTLTVAAADIPETNPVVALRMKCRGTAGSVYVGSFSVDSGDADELALWRHAAPVIALGSGGGGVFCPVGSPIVSPAGRLML